MNIEALFTAHRTELLRFLTRYTGDPEWAEDAVQETYLRLVVRPPERLGSPRAWLYRVAANVVRDDWKTRHRELLLARWDDIPSVRADDHPDEVVEQREDRRRLRRALAALTARQRAILLMRLEGFSHAEIAEAVGTTVKSVGTMTARALRRLRGELNGTD